MPIEYPEGAPKVEDHRIEKAIDYLVTYQSTLRKVFEDLSDDSKRSLAGIPNPHLATGPMEVVVCTNGVVATIQNGLASSDITGKVIIPNVPMTMIEYFNSAAERLYTFMDPISKLYSKGSSAVFEDGPVYDGLLTTVIVVDRMDRMWLPPATKVFLMGWQFFEHCDFHAKAQEAARQSVTDAYGLINLRSRVAAKRLLEEYRALLNRAASEDDLQAFLEAHPEFVYPEHDLASPKPSLGGERQPDFAFSIRSAFGPRWLFVEIERPDKLIFTKGKNCQFTHEFTQAKGQLLQWDTLITRDHAFFARRFPGLLRAEFHLIYGRDTELDASRREMLTAEFSTTPNRTFSTFDDLANRFETIISRIFPASTG
jgi:hypothetical protein